VDGIQHILQSPVAPLSVMDNVLISTASDGDIGEDADGALDGGATSIAAGDGITRAI